MLYQELLYVRLVLVACLFPWSVRGLHFAVRKMAVVTSQSLRTPDAGKEHAWVTAAFLMPVTGVLADDFRLGLRLFGLFRLFGLHQTFSAARVGGAL